MKGDKGLGTRDKGLGIRDKGDKILGIKKDSYPLPILPPWAFILIACLLGMGGLSGCVTLSGETTRATAQRPQGEARRGGVTPVDVAIASTGLLQQPREYTATTEPVRFVSLRSQVEGQLLALTVDVGNRVTRGQVIGQVDDSLLRTALNQAEAQLATLESEVARAKAQVSNARTDIERARLELAQAQSDAQRQEKLYKQGAVSAQAAEQASTEAQTALQALRAATEQVRTEQQAVTAAQGRVVAQQAVVAEERQRREFSRLVSPITGSVVERPREAGDLVRPGEEILKLGDFSRVQIKVNVSDRDLPQIRIGQSVRVSLEAFPNQTFIGQVTRISPPANSTSFLVPVEVVIPNPDGKIGSSLFARVRFDSDAPQRVVIPETALGGREQGAGSRGAGSRGHQAGGTKQGAPSRENISVQNPKSKIQNSQGTVFVVVEVEGNPKVTARAVTLGERVDGKVEVLSGLQPGERYVVRSGKPLKEGETVRLSIISEGTGNR